MSSSGVPALWRSVIIGALSLAIYCYLVLAQEPINAILGLFSDDAFYYLQIARNIVDGYGPTFDRIVPTNGFHPLWMAIVVLFSWCVGTDGHAAALAVLGLNGVLMAATLLVVHRLVNRFVATGLGLVAIALCLLPPVLWAMLNGLETGLLLFSTTVLLWFCYSKRIHELQATGRASLAFGALLGVVVLSRLDAVFLLLAAATLNGVAMLMDHSPARRWLLRAALVFVGFMLIVGPYAVWNLDAFGHIMPISGAVKSSFPSLRASLELSGDSKFAVFLLAFLVGLVVIAPSAGRAQTLRGKISSPLTLICVACLFHFLHTWLFMAWGVYWWHFTLYGLAISLAFCDVTQGHLSRWPAIYRRSFAAATVILLGAFTTVVTARVAMMKAQQHGAWLEAAEWARNRLDSVAVIAMKDAGLFGYFVGRQVVNLDGKVNGYSYLDHLREGRVCEYLDRVGAHYVADVRGSSSSEIPVVAIQRAGGGAYLLRLKDAQVLYRSAAIRKDLRDAFDPGVAHFVIWKMSKEQRAE